MNRIIPAALLLLAGCAATPAVVEMGKAHRFEPGRRSDEDNRPRTDEDGLAEGETRRAGASPAWPTRVGPSFTWDMQCTHD